MKIIHAFSFALVLLSHINATLAQSVGESLISEEELIRVPKVPKAEPLPDESYRVLVIGDSLAKGIGFFLKDRAKRNFKGVEVFNAGKVSSGLSRSDFYNWPQKFEALLKDKKPHIVVAHFGANDKQTLISSKMRVHYGVAGWSDAYVGQMKNVLRLAEKYGAVMYWLAPAPDRNVKLNRHLLRINKLMKDTVPETGATLVLLDNWVGNGGADFRFVSGRTIQGKYRNLRTGDGTHFTSAGNIHIANRLLTAMQKRFSGFGGADHAQLAFPILISNLQ